MSVYPDKQTITAALTAAKRGDYNTLLPIVKKYHPDSLMESDSITGAMSGKTPMYLAVLWGQPKIVKLLCVQGANANGTGKNPHAEKMSYGGEQTYPRPSPMQLAQEMIRNQPAMQETYNQIIATLEKCDKVKGELVGERASVYSAMKEKLPQPLAAKFIKDYMPLVAGRKKRKTRRGRKAKKTRRVRF